MTRRIGALTAPVLAGVLLEAGWSPRSLFGLFALPLLLAAGSVAAIMLAPRRHAAIVRAAPSSVRPS